MSPDHARIPEWFSDLLDLDHPPGEGETVELSGKRYRVDGGILRAEAVFSANQAQTAETFGFKWHQLGTFDGDAAVKRTREWLVERYGDVAGADWWDDYGDRPLVLDAGCGAALSSLALFGNRLTSVRFAGTDISTSVDVAAARCADAGVAGAFVQDDLLALPLPARSVDVVFAEGVLHHTDSTRDALLRLAELLHPAWKALEPLTHLGIALGELHGEVVIPEDIDLLEIPAGRYDVQRLFYWHVAKAFYHPDLTFDELTHINYDWYAPANAHRQTPEEVRAWCDEAGLEIEREQVEEAGITVIARRRD